MASAYDRGNEVCAMGRGPGEIVEDNGLFLSDFMTLIKSSFTVEAIVPLRDQKSPPHHFPNPQGYRDTTN